MIFRCARHTNDIERLTEFYITILGFEIVGSFRDHDLYSGVLLGKRGLNWHLEFTQSHDAISHSFDEDDLLIFYPETAEEYDMIQACLQEHNIPLLQHRNPYWKMYSSYFKDPDGYGIIVSKLRVK